MNVKLLIAAGVSALTVFAAEGDKPALPLSAVTLYSSGTGLFERSGSVEGDAAIELKFRTENINDLLKSMVLQDFSGGSVTSVAYDSRDPVTKTLRSFSLDLTGNPSMGELLNQMRGQRVRVSWPNTVSGTILGVEKREEILTNNGEEKRVTTEHLNLLSSDGLVSIPLKQISKLAIENQSLQRELNQALEVLARSHDTDKKTVAIHFEGEGKRDVRVSYIGEAPVWKTSYRLVIDEKDPFLQGWAIVENTTDEDWQNVELSLVSGRPISFVMDLYEPLYVERPVVQPELFLSLRPQVYGDDLEGRAKRELSAQRLTRGDGALGRAAAPAARNQFDVFSAEMGAVGGGAVAGAITGRPLVLAEGISSQAQGQTAGELFAYSMKSPVSISRQQSAMLPIVNEKVEGEKVGIYNESVHVKHPLNGYRLRNTTDLHLMQGPITVFDGRTYAGDARVEDIAPGQDRLISYAVDLQTEVAPERKSEPEDLLSVRIRRGTLIATKRLVEEKKYLVRNKDQKAKKLLIEHPVRPDWTLAEDLKPAERTRGVYRFAVTVAADQSETLAIREERRLVEQAHITSLSSDMYMFLIRSRKLSPEILKVLERVVAYKERLNQLAAERTHLEQNIQEITQEQARIRENMTRLNQSSDLYARYVRKFDEQETEVETFRKEIATLKDRETHEKREMERYLDSLEI